MTTDLQWYLGKVMTMELPSHDLAILSIDSESHDLLQSQGLCEVMPDLQSHGLWQGYTI